MGITRIRDGQIRLAEGWILMGDSDGKATAYRQVFAEGITGDGSTTAFNLTYTPITTTIQLFQNGLLQKQGASDDYSVSGKQITFAVAPESTDIIQVDYLATD